MRPQRSGASRSSLGTINVIFASPRKDFSSVKGVMTISSQLEGSEREAPLGLADPRIF